jgi:SAM-dependent methyltransferase
LSRHGFAVEAIEIDSSSYRKARVFPVINYDGQHIPYPDCSFDFVFSSNVLEHIVDLSALNREIRRVLRETGLAVHVLPTHTWRLWTTLTLVPACFEYVLTRRTAIAVHPPLTLGTSKSLWYKLRRHFGRHGEHGTLLSEHWLFHPHRWRRAFKRDAFKVVEERPLGIFYTGNMMFGSKLSIRRRKSLSRFLGSSCYLYVARPDY